GERGPGAGTGGHRRRRRRRGRVRLVQGLGPRLVTGGPGLGGGGWVLGARRGLGRGGLGLGGEVGPGRGIRRGRRPGRRGGAGQRCRLGRGRATGLRRGRGRGGGGRAGVDHAPFGQGPFQRGLSVGARLPLGQGVAAFVLDDRDVPGRHSGCR